MSNQGNSQMAVSSTMVALYNFDAHDEPEISMKKGDRIEMLDMDPALNGWAYGRKKTDGSEGYVPISYLGSSNSSSRSHKHSKSVSQPSRSSSPNPSKSRHEDNKNYRQNYGRNNQNNYNSHNNMNNNNVHGNNNQSNENSNNLHGNNNNNNMNQNTNTNSNSNNNMTQQQNNNSNNNNSNQKPQNNMSSNNMNNSNNNNNNMNNTNDPSSDNTKQIICSFHRDFIPEMNDLYKYFGEFGKITNKLEIEYDAKKVPLAKIKFASASCVDKVCDKGGRQQIPSQSQNGTIHIRVYRSMQDYLNNTQRSRSHGGYNKHKNSRRGGF